MRNTIRKTLLGCMLALGGLTASAQGLEGVIVEEFHTITQADADFINIDLGNSTIPIVAGSKVYRVYVDMAPNYKFLTVSGSAPTNGIGVHPLDFTTTTTFWNDDNFGTEFPAQTRRASTGTIFDSYITIGSTGTAGGASPCGALGSGLAQVGVLRTADTNGDLTSCGVFPGFTGNDGSIPGTVPALSTNLSGLLDFTALTGSASSFVIGGNSGDAYATLPAGTGVDPATTNRVLIGQFTTDGVFSFHINVSIQSPGGVDESYTWANPILSEVVSPFLTYPSAACNPPVFASSGSNGPVCAGQALNLNALANGDATITYSWAGPNSFTSTAQNPSIAGATTAATGTYTVTATNACAPAATATVSVVVNAPANAGTNGTLTICAGSTVTAGQLFAQLGGTPQAGGTWSPALAGAGVYTYTVNGTAPCTNATATVTVTAQPQPNAGTNGTLTICAGSTVNAAQLFAQLGGTPAAGGSWSPAFAGAGVYTYTVAAVAPCTGNATATVSVTEQALPNAGTNGTLTICAGSTVNAAQLFAQLGGAPAAGGSWSPAFAGAGVYTYAVAATAPCTGNATATVTVTEQAQPNAGTNGTLTICAGSTVNAAQLFAQLGGAPAAGGTWSPAFAGAGVYTYTVAATAPCTGNATATVTVTEQAQPDAGTNGTLSICSTAAAQSLFAQLGGTPDAGGAWSGPSPVTGGNYNPATMSPGVYTYSVAATAPCTGNVTATVTVTETASGVWYQDSDNDGAGDPNVVLNQCDQPAGYVANNNDLCPADANKIAPGACGCGVADVAATYYTDVDGDGFGDPASPVAGFTCLVPVGTVTNNTDNCPALSGLQGDVCNDNNASTNNDVITAACVCAGTPVGATDCLGVPGGPALPGTPCDDGLATTGNDVYQANCTCAGQVIDCLGVAGGTALPGSACDDGLATTGNDVYGANCVCAGQVIDCLGVAGGTALPGTACNDNNPNSTGDVYGANCVCAGVLANDCLGVPGGPAQPGTPCDDGNASTGNDVYGANCVCAGLPFDCLGVAGGTALPGTPCNDGLATTGNDVYGGDCVCAGQVIDCLGVIGGTTLPGTPCNDANPLTENDVYLANCQCQGTPIGGCTEIVSIEFNTDASPAQTSWEVIPEGGGAVVCSGAGSYPANTTITETCCLPQGCYALRVLDGAGDGISNGGYILREGSSNQRIIDNRNNFSNGSVSAISGAQGFCLPLGTDRLINTNCDKLSWVANQYVVATENTSVSATWVPNGANAVQPANSGYEFWIFDPNGSYSFRRFRSHNVSDGFSPANATRACHMKINSWVNTVSTPHIPANVLMNVRVRGRVNGINSVFGPACRFKLDPARAACPLTQLLNVAGNANSSCGATRNFGNGNYVYAQPPQFVPAVSASLLRYQFRFRNTATGFETIRQSNTYILPLNWTGSSALQCGVTYTVDVRVSKDNGATWCIDSPTPAQPFTAWGEVCTLTIAACTGNAALAPETAVGNEVSLTMYPNPNRGDQLFLSLSEVAADINTVSVDIFDMTGKRVAARTIAVQDGFVNTAMELNGDLAGGLYMVNITAGDKTYTERLVIQP